MEAAYPVEFVCCVLGLTLSDCTIFCLSSYSKQAARIYVNTANGLCQWTDFP